MSVPLYTKAHMSHGCISGNHHRNAKVIPPGSHIHTDQTIPYMRVCKMGDPNTSRKIVGLSF